MADEATDKAKWTVMVYMAAGDDADLDAYAVTDLQEMEGARFGDDVNVVVQINRYWPDRAQRYGIDKWRRTAGRQRRHAARSRERLRPTGGPSAARSLNMGRGATLGVLRLVSITIRPIATRSCSGATLRPGVRPRSRRPDDADGDA